MIQVEERRRRTRTSSLDDWLRDTGGAALRRAGTPFRDAARRIWDKAVLTFMTVAMVAASAVFLLVGAVELLKELKLPAWLAYGMLGVAGGVAGYLLWRTALGDKG
ncbi:MAG TPA: hypothetical protein VF950_04565 [Planctomycetota bacterium]